MCRHSLWGTELCSTRSWPVPQPGHVYFYSRVRAALAKLVFTPLFSLILCLSLSLFFFLFSYRVSEWSVRWFVCRLLVWGRWRLFFFSVLSEYTPHHKKKKHTKYLFYFLIYWIELLVESMHAQWFNQMLLKNECWEAAHRLCEGERQTLVYVYVSAAHISRERVRNMRGHRWEIVLFVRFFVVVASFSFRKWYICGQREHVSICWANTRTLFVCLFFFFCFFSLVEGSQCTGGIVAARISHNERHQVVKKNGSTICC